jgi:hypothetical protein
MKRAAETALRRPRRTEQPHPNRRLQAVDSDQRLRSANNADASS